MKVEQVIDIIRKNLNGRELVSLGEDRDLEHVLYEQAGLLISFHIFGDEKKIDEEQKRYPMKKIDNGRNKYYLLIPKLPIKDNDVAWLNRNGFNEESDYIHVRRWKENVTIIYEYGKKTIQYPTYSVIEECPNKTTFIEENEIRNIPRGIKIICRGDSNRIVFGESTNMQNSVITLNSNNRIEFGNNVILTNGLISSKDDSDLMISQNVRIGEESTIDMYNNSNICIDEFCNFGKKIFLASQNYTSILIGNHCAFFDDVRIQGSDGHAILDGITGMRTNGSSLDNRRVVEIGNNVWCGFRVGIVGNTIIGNNCVIGAHSFVKGKFANNLILGGIPAKVLKENMTWRANNGISCLEESEMREGEECLPYYLNRSESESPLDEKETEYCAVFDDINKELNRICRKYKINYMYPELDYLEYIEDVINEIIQNETVDNIYIVSDHQTDLNEMKRIIRGNRKVNYCLCKESDFLRNSAEKEVFFLIVSFDSNLQIEMELYSCNNKNWKICNLYSYMQRRGVYINTPFYKIQKPLITYANILCTRKALEAANDDERKWFYEKLICEYCEIRDFESLWTAIDQYIEKGYDKGNYLCFKNELQKFLSALKKKIRTDKREHIIVNWIDNIGNNIEDFSFLKNIREESIYFENAYTNIPWTRSTLVEFVTGLLGIEGKSYSSNMKYTSKNSILLRLLEENGYQFRYYAYPQFEERFSYFEKEAYIDNTYKNYNLKLPEAIENVGCSSKLQWEALRTMLLSPKKQFIIIHSMTETHGPFLSSQSSAYCAEFPIIKGYKVEQQGIRLREEKKGHQSLDKILSFYNEFYGKDVVRVFLSDHGSNQVSYADLRCKILFMVKSHKQISCKRKDLYSHVEFCKVVEDIIKSREIRTFDKGYVILQNFDMQSMSKINDAKEIIRKGKNINYLSSFLQYRAVKTLTDTYVLFSNGEEVYFLNSDEKEWDGSLKLPDVIHNRIREMEYTNRIQNLREMCGTSFVDIYKVKDFENSRLLYTDIPKPKKWLRESKLRSMIKNDDLECFLQSITALKDQLIVLMVVDDNASSGVDEWVAEKIKELGIVTEIRRNNKFSFVAVIVKGISMYENCSKEKISSWIDMNQKLVFLESAGIETKSCSSSCIYDGVEYVIDRARGLNMVLLDALDEKEIMTVRLDIFDHKNELFICD
ncbi:MAG: sulfatase-like hydrolase/transferase [Lachnospiraceae bacterium]